MHFFVVFRFCICFGLYIILRKIIVGWREWEIRERGIRNNQWTAKSRRRNRAQHVKRITSYDRRTPNVVYNMSWTDLQENRVGRDLGTWQSNMIRRTDGRIRTFIHMYLFAWIDIDGSNVVGKIIVNGARISSVVASSTLLSRWRIVALTTRRSHPPT